MLQPWQLFTLAGLIGATVVVFITRGQTAAAMVLLSVTVFTAAALGVAAWRMLAPLTGRDDPAGPQVLGGRTRAALEREKTLVLRSIKELEFDRAMGKVSDRDFAEMSARLRSRAAGLLRQLDAGTGYRQEIEKEIERRMRVSDTDAARAFVARERGPQGSAPPGPQESERGPQGSERGPQGSAPQVLCAACGKGNDVDARFCKHCGARMEQGE